MAHYLIQAAYTSEAWANQIKNPSNRLEQVNQMMASCRLHGSGSSPLKTAVLNRNGVTASTLRVRRRPVSWEPPELEGNALLT